MLVLKVRVPAMVFKPLLVLEQLRVVSSLLMPGVVFIVGLCCSYPF